ncbi:diacylglycerol kinase theta-like [Babylonia areolata]|uniref:diacylglycerol kinase theta-like n=1 Tax=Babylonia areolata TaxID=304850 RepID=UPI003FD671D1
MAEDTEAGESPSGSPLPPDQGHGHFFVKKTFHKPTYCHHCTDILWGLIGVGYVCEVCNFVVHDRCMKTVISPCSSIATNLIKNPVAHCWSEPGHFKRKFCNVCRKRLEDSTAIRCEICEYYAHLDCQDFVVSDCKECSTYQPHKDYIVQYHHWREGNLPPNSKCVACKKTCWSAECLAGMRCEWCGVTSHPLCYKSLPPECKFGSLREIELPPTCLTIPRMDVPMETLLGINRKPTRTVSEEWSSSGDSKTEDEEKERRSPREKDGRDKDKDADYEVIRVYDGNGSLKKRMYRAISVPRSAPAHILLEAALKTFHISDEPTNYYLTEICDSGKSLLEGALKSCHVSDDPRDSGERELDGTAPIRAQLRTPDGKRPSVFLRFREKNPDRGHIRVYPGALRVSVTYKYIPVTRDTTADEVITLALRKFGVEDVPPENFSLMEVLLDKGVAERRVDRGDRPWQIMQQSRRESLRQNRMTRFYLQQKEDPHGPSISLFVGNLPTGLSQRQYEKILLDIIGKENKWNSFDVIYYEYGALVLIYTDPEQTTHVFNILQESIIHDKQLLVLLLPNIQPHMLPEGVQPLMVFVNVKSGGCQGTDLITSFRKLLNPHQVFNLDNGGPLPGLYVFRNIPYYKILVCGGDGSVGWVLSCLDNVGQDALCQSPPMAIVPLGTGNDLARVLRWGPGYTGGEDPLNVLRDVIDAEEIKLDRWTVIFHPNEKEQDETKVAIANDTNSANTNEDPTKIFVMNNYFGIGIDAEVCLDFHTAREEKPNKFNSRLVNKVVYFKIGLRHMVNRKTCKDLHRHIKVEVDGKLIDLPPVEGIVILNILSWGSGANLWGPEREDTFNKPTHYDGMLEIVGVTGVVHMGQIQSGLRTGVRIAQGGHLRITLLTDIPVQVDGEPWIQPAGQVVVLRSALKATMLKKSKNKIKRRNTEPSIFFPEDEPLQQAQSPSEESGPL